MRVSTCLLLHILLVLLEIFSYPVVIYFKKSFLKNSPNLIIPCALVLLYARWFQWLFCGNGLPVIYDSLPLDTSIFVHTLTTSVLLKQCFDNAINLQWLPFSIGKKNSNCLAWNWRSSTICPTYIPNLVSHSSARGTTPPEQQSCSNSWPLLVFSPFFTDYPSMTCILPVHDMHTFKYLVCVRNE